MDSSRMCTTYGQVSRLYRRENPVRGVGSVVYSAGALELWAEMALHEVRKAQALMQKALREALAVKQSVVGKLVGARTCTLRTCGRTWRRRAAA